MQISGVFLGLGEDRLKDLLRVISIGKLRTYQIYERFKIRTHLAKVNTENLRKAAPRFWQRLSEHDEEFATDLSQAILVSHLELIAEILHFLGIPNHQGFFEEGANASEHLTEGWQLRVWEKFRTDSNAMLLLFYINHLGWETGGETTVFLPPA